MNITMHQLRLFIELCHHESVTKAADAMHMTQPALSIQLKKIQDQFSLPLTERIGRKIFITDFGYSIAEIAKKIVFEAENLKYKTKEYEGLLVGSLRIASASTGKYVIPYFLSEFVQKHPGIDLNLDVSNKETVIQNLKENSIDLALVSQVPDDLDVNEEILLENHLYLVGKPGLKFDRNTRLIFREQGSATRKSMDQYFKSEQIRKSIELTSNEAVKQAVIAGLGATVMPLIGIKNELRNQELEIISKSDLPIITHWKIIWLKEKKLAQAPLRFLNYLREHKNTIKQQHFSWYDNYRQS